MVVHREMMMKLLNYSCDLRSAKFNFEVLSEKFEKTLLVRFPPANSGNTSKTEFKAQFSEKLALEEKVIWVVGAIRILMALITHQGI